MKKNTCFNSNVQNVYQNEHSMINKINLIFVMNFKVLSLVKYLILNYNSRERKHIIWL